MHKKGRFTEIGVILEKMDNGSYLIEKENGKTIKKRHYDIKKHNFVGGGDVGDVHLHA